jgi:hypothetical protein
MDEWNLAIQDIDLETLQDRTDRLVRNILHLCGEALLPRSLVVGAIETAKWSYFTHWQREQDSGDEEEDPEAVA